MHRKYHARVSVSLSMESIQIVIKHPLVGTTLDLNKRDFVQSGVLHFNINSLGTSFHPAWIWASSLAAAHHVPPGPFFT